jgi:toxin-antitoxin system PIN domain toxin
MIAIDTNLLVYAHRRATPEHRAARRAIEHARRGGRGWGVAEATLVEFWAVVTHPAPSGRPSTSAEATSFVEGLKAAGCLAWAQGPAFASRLFRIAADLEVAGARIFDLQIALTARDNGATEIWSHDARFVAVPGLTLVDPIRQLQR